MENLQESGGGCEYSRLICFFYHELREFHEWAWLWTSMLD